jgi:hypothetical protein
VSEPGPERVLYEVRLALAGEVRLVRLRAESVDEARAVLATHYPGWHPLKVHRWVGEGWVASPPSPA